MDPHDSSHPSIRPGRSGPMKHAPPSPPLANATSVRPTMHPGWPFLGTYACCAGPFAPIAPICAQLRQWGRAQLRPIAPICAQFRQWGRAQLRPIAPICAQLRSCAPDGFQLRPTAPDCAQLHQLETSPIAPDCTRLRPVAPDCTQLLQLRSIAPSCAATVRYLRYSVSCKLSVTSM